MLTFFPEKYLSDAKITRDNVEEEESRKEMSKCTRRFVHSAGLSRNALKTAKARARRRTIRRGQRPGGGGDEEEEERRDREGSVGSDRTSGGRALRPEPRPKKSSTTEALRPPCTSQSSGQASEVRGRVSQESCVRDARELGTRCTTEGHDV